MARIARTKEKMKNPCSFLNGNYRMNPFGVTSELYVCQSVNTEKFQQNFLSVSFGIGCTEKYSQSMFLIYCLGWGADV